MAGKKNKLRLSLARKRSRKTVNQKMKGTTQFHCEKDKEEIGISLIGREKRFCSSKGGGRKWAVLGKENLERTTIGGKKESTFDNELKREKTRGGKRR